MQTWIARHEIFRRPGVTGTLESLTARFGELEITNLHLSAPGAVLTLPALKAALPLTTAARRKFLVQSVEAKGWTLDLSHPAPPAEETEAAPAPGNPGEAGAAAEGEASPAQKAAAFFDRLLSEWQLPCDLSLDRVDLEGDVLVPPAGGGAPFRVHVLIKGGGLASGREGSFAVTAAVTDLRLPLYAVSAQGQLAVAMNTPRTINRLELNADFSAQRGASTKGLTLATDFAAARGPGEEDYTLDLAQDGRHLATFLARYPAASRELAGRWQLDLRDSDLTPFLLDRPVPSVAAAGEGQFEADAGFARVHALGQLKASGSRLEVIAPELERLGAVTLAAGFDLAETGPSFRVDRLNLALTGEHLTAAVQALQPFELDSRTRELKTVRPDDDWLAISFHGFPLAWLSDPTSRLTFAGDAEGDLFARAAQGGFSARAQRPLTATGVTLQGADRAVVGGLDLSVPLQASYNPAGWQVQSGPLTIRRGGRELGSLDAKVSQAAGEDEPVAVAGTWKADLAALADTAAIPEAAGLAGRSASGDFSAKLGSATEFETKLALVGLNPDHAAHGECRRRNRRDGRDFLRGAGQDRARRQFLRNVGRGLLERLGAGQPPRFQADERQRRPPASPPPGRPPRRGGQWPRGRGHAEGAGGSGRPECPSGAAGSGGRRWPSTTCTRPSAIMMTWAGPSKSTPGPSSLRTAGPDSPASAR